MELTNIPPIYVYTQDSTPSDLTEGKIWVDTSTNPPVTKVSDGTIYNALSTNLTPIRKLIGLNGLNILDITAQSTLTEGINANFERDIYSDSTGYLNTIDAGNTTAFFDTNKYHNTLISEDNLTSLIGNFSGLDSYTNPSGVILETTSNMSISKIQFVDGNATKGYIYEWVNDETMGDLLGSATLINGLATFENPIILDASTKYFLVDDGEGESYTAYWVHSVTFPISITGGSIIKSITNGNPGTNDLIDVFEINSTIIENKIIQTNAQTLNTTPTTALIVANETTAGTGTITYDISTDNGSNYQTAQTSGTEISLTNAGTELILKQNLNGVGAGNTSETIDYGVLLW